MTGADSAAGDVTSLRSARPPAAPPELTECCSAGRVCRCRPAAGGSDCEAARGSGGDGSAEDRVPPRTGRRATPYGFSHGTRFFATAHGFSRVGPGPAGADAGEHNGETDTTAGTEATGDLTVTSGEVTVNVASEPAPEAEDQEPEFSAVEEVKKGPGAESEPVAEEEVLVPVTP